MPVDDALIRISIDDLSLAALNGIVDEFISRDSTIGDASFAVKRERVIRALKNGTAFVAYSSQTKTTNIMTEEEFAQCGRG